MRLCVSNKKMQEFQINFFDALELSPIEFDFEKQNIQEIPEFDSLGKINIALMLREKYQIEAELDDLSNAETLLELYQMLMND